MTNRGNHYIAFIDETGDHGMANINPQYPYLGIIAVLYRRETYITEEVPALTRLKMDFWGHEGVIFHDYDIRKKVGPFRVLIDTTTREAFWLALCEHFSQSKAKIISAVIDKEAHAAQYNAPENPYRLAVQFVLERIHMEAGSGVPIVFESRGKKEDKVLSGWCEEICNGGNFRGNQFDFDVSFAKKKDNVAGLQISDLACLPIIEGIRNPDTERADWVAVKSCIRKSHDGRLNGWGLKIFP